MMKKVLIITKSNDNQCIDRVSEAIVRKGGIPIRFNTDTYPLSSAINIEYINNKWRTELVQGDQRFDLSDLESVWYRRLAIGANLGTVLEEKFKNPAVEECKRTFLGMFGTLNAFLLDDYWKVKQAENKLLQLKVAEKLGLEIPETLMANSPNSLPPFYKALEGNVITKMQASFAIYEKGKENVVFTNPISENDLNDLDGLQYCPMTFQRNIEKKLELRITIVGNKVFTASIDPNSSERAKNDWRKDGVGLIRDWKKYDLPEDIEQKLLKLMDYFQLTYGAIDMIVTNDNRYVFLEVNPAGEFFWLDINPGFPISETIADTLLNKENRRHEQKTSFNN